MLKNFLKVAFRNLFRYKGFAVINIAGLALGITACLLIGLFVRDEKQFDKFVPEGERVYRIYNERTDNEGTEINAPAPPVFATTIREFPEVEQTARVMMQSQYKRLFEAGGKKIYEESGFIVDSTFFEVFPLHFIYGTALNVLDDPTDMVISNELAKRLFGNENPVGKQLQMEKQLFIVKGVVEKPSRFHLSFDFLVPLSSAGIPVTRMESWGWNQFYNYVKLKKHTNVVAVEDRFRKIVNEKTAAFADGEGLVNKPYLQPLEKIHLYSSGFKYDMAVRGNITYVKALTIIALFILLIACFNFINLATAKSLQRAKEVGVRKSIGASRRQLIFQFLGETFVLSLISVLVSIALTFLAIPWLNGFTEKHIVFDLFTNPWIALSLLSLTLLVGLIAGLYPAFVLSDFQPVKVLKGSLAGDAMPGKIPWLRHGLVVIQFSLSVLLIISALVVFRQVHFLHNKDLGFNKEELIFFPMRGDGLFKNYEAFKNDLLQSSQVSSVSIGYGFPGDAVAGDQVIVPGKNNGKPLSATMLMVDFDYIKTLGLKMVSGREFSKEMKTDANHAFILNETAVRELGFETPQKALGERLQWPVWGASNPDSMKNGQIIGVVKDFHYKSLYDKVEITVMQIFPDAYWKVAVKVKTGDIKTTLAHIHAVWSKFSPDYPLEYKFLDENFTAMYKSEDKLKVLLWIFTGVAIFVGCLGLFGLAAYAAQRRIKEIGIRKVLGASVKGIVFLMSKDFIKLVIIALLIASPIAWYVMNDWLKDFAYRTSVAWWVFGVAGLSAIVIALITVSFQSVKAALANPVKNLRTE